MKNLRFPAVFLVTIGILCCSYRLPTSNPYPFTITTTGTGTKTAILIPGFACSGDVWTETVSQLSSNYTCYSLTMAGFAGVPAQPNASFTNWETAVARFIKDKKLENPVVIGHSMGGAMAMALAADYPDLVGKIVVVDALPCLAALMDPAFKSKPVNDCSSIVTRMTSLATADFAKMQKSAIGSLLADTGRQAAVVNWSLQSDRTTFATLYCDFLNTDLRGKVARIHCPNLIMMESYFATMKPQLNEQFRTWENANLQFATKGLHFIMYDDKEWYNAELTKFMNQ